MAATIINEDENLEEEQPQELEAAQVETSEDDVPEKYRGKDSRDLIRMHQEAEAAIGRQGNEVGELRKAVDAILEANLKKDTPDEPTPDWFDDPDKAMEAKLANHPAIKSAQQTSEIVRQQNTRAQLLQKHPDISDVLQDPSFTEWVGKSKFRKDLFKEGQSYNFDAADELVTLYKERRGVVAQTAAVETQQRSQSIRDASTGSSRGTGASPQKTFRRVDLIKLMKDDPDRYEAMESEISAAYAQGRVR